MVISNKKKLKVDVYGYHLAENNSEVTLCPPCTLGKLHACSHCLR